MDLIPKSIRLLAPILKKLSRRAKFCVRYQELLASYGGPEPDGSTDPNKVFEFISSVLKKLIPRNLIGKENVLTFMLSVRRLILGTRYEESSLHDWLQGLKVSKVDWLPSANRHPSQHLRNAQLLGGLVGWLAERVVVPLIWSHFHATEVQGKGYKVCYYRQDIWQAMKKAAMINLEEEELFQRVTRVSSFYPEALGND